MGVLPRQRRAGRDHADLERNALWPRIALSLPATRLYIEGRLLGKPASIDEAREQWRLMAGRAATYTGHGVIRLQDNKTVYRAAEQQ